MLQYVSKTQGKKSSKQMRKQTCNSTLTQHKTGESNLGLIGEAVHLQCTPFVLPITNDLLTITIFHIAVEE